MALYRCTVNLSFPVGSGGGTNTWHLRTGTGTDEDNNVEALMQKVAFFYEAVSPLLPASWEASWDGTALEIATAEPTLVTAPGGGWSQNGEATGGYTGAASMGCVTWRTASPTRSGRGRTFVGPLAATAVQDDGTLGNTALSLLQQAGQSIPDSTGSSVAGALVVFSQAQQLGRDITSSSVTDQVAVLRSRRG